MISKKKKKRKRFPLSCFIPALSACYTWLFVQSNLQQILCMSFHPKYFSFTLRLSTVPWPHLTIENCSFVIYLACVNFLMWSQTYTFYRRLIKIRIQIKLTLGGCPFYSVKNSLFLHFLFILLVSQTNRITCLMDCLWFLEWLTGELLDLIS